MIPTKLCSTVNPVSFKVLFSYLNWNILSRKLKHYTSSLHRVYMDSCVPEVKQLKKDHLSDVLSANEMHKLYDCGWITINECTFVLMRLWSIWIWYFGIRGFCFLLLLVSSLPSSLSSWTYLTHILHPSKRGDSCEVIWGHMLKGTWWKQVGTAFGLPYLHTHTHTHTHIHIQRERKPIVRSNPP